MTHTKTPDWSELKRLAEAAGQGKDAEDVSWNDIRFRDAANPATVLELIAEVERLRANAEKMEKLYRGLSVERGDLQTEFIEMRSERDALKAQVAEERDWQNEIRKVCKEAMGGNTTFIDDDVARAITALKSQRDEMAEALGKIAKNETEVFDEAEQATVIVPDMGEEEMSALAYQTLQRFNIQNGEA